MSNLNASILGTSGWSVAASQVSLSARSTLVLGSLRPSALHIFVLLRVRCDLNVSVVQAWKLWAEFITWEVATINWSHNSSGICVTL